MDVEKNSALVISLVGQQAGQPESQYPGHQEGQQAAEKSVGRLASEKNPSLPCDARIMQIAK